MTISIRPARYESDRQELVNALQINLPQLPHERLFSWLYLLNPAGCALTWIATDSETQRVIGIAAAFPRHAYYRGQEVRSYVLGDFCIDANHRSLGLALSLQRACLEGLSKGDASFAFDFPSRQMLAIYERLKIEIAASMVRYAKPLRVDRKIAKHIPFRAVARGLGAPVNAALRLRDKHVRRDGNWTIAVETAPWGEEFTRAAREWSRHTIFCVTRSAEYLNWRYGEHPLQKYEMLTVRRGADLSGYLIHHANGEDLNIADLFAEDDTARSLLLAEVTMIARRFGAHTVSVPWLATHPGRHLLEERGFRPRESSPVALLAFPRPTQPRVEPAKEEWYLTSGDWES